MTQQSMYPEIVPVMTALNISVSSFPATKNPDEVRVDVRVAVNGGTLTSVAIEVFTGYEQDFLNTYVAEALSIYCYGESKRQMMRSLAAVKKMARAHAGKHQP